MRERLHIEHRVLFLALVAAFVGFYSAAVLSLGHLLDLPVPCGGSQGCATVAGHPASRILGMPIAYLGIAGYSLVIFLLFQQPESFFMRSCLSVITGIFALTSVMLLVYSQTVIGATCSWCLASGVAMTLLFLLSLVILRTKSPLQPVRPVWFLVFALITSGAVGVQAGMMKRAANAPPIATERLQAVSPERLIDPAKSLGPSDAPITIVMLTDFWCPACRSAHETLVNYQQNNRRGVRLVFRHLPLSTIRGHELSGAAAALSEIAAEQDKFWPFVERVLRHPGPMVRDDYLSLMSDLEIDTEGVEARIADPDDPAVVSVRTDVELADELGVRSTPTFVVIVDGHSPLSANQHTLPRLLNSTPVLAHLIRAAREDGKLSIDQQPSAEPESAEEP
jgi:protein-disulfide isomerase/uncharacterized membrane protein